MISSLTGSVKAVGHNFVILENQGIGYRVVLPLTQLLALRPSETISLFIHEHQREDGRELFGFKDFEELVLADKLLTVSGVGPKIAQLLVGLGVDKVRSAILSGDTSVFLSVSGIGKKRAQQIILELKGSIDTQNLEGPKDELMLALEQLGYGAKEISEVLRKISRTGTTEERLREALGQLGN